MTAAVPDAGRRRREEVATGLDRVRARISAACAGAARDAADVTLVVVTKTYPASDVALLAELGVRDVGENRDQEAAAKHAAVADLGLRWHFIGQLQSNKARSVAGYADLVHSVDRPSLVTALDRAAAGHDRVLDCLLQVSLDGDPARGGVPVADLPGLAERAAAAENLRLRGVMAVAPLGADPLRAFAPLRELLATVREHAPQADLISAGMSGDLEAGVTSGATHLRVGSAILGSRPPRQ
ncbi:MAG TPA: YggS family pyridoxal phosphate-dependent enzyme [Kineosporiaceae bacterium]|nr:YggS family pyridoxal phosphate-dependent enzyme [Kineosporiaceae bacterium]